MATIQYFAGKIPLLGVCLGHQAIGAAFGGNVVRAPELMHGKTSAIRHDGKKLFRGIENPFIATRYHSLIIAEESLPSCLEISARSESGLIMGVRHREFLVEGLQFHPESILTTAGKKILQNFLQFSSFSKNDATTKVVEPVSLVASHNTKSGNHKLQQFISQVLGGTDLDRRQAYEAMHEIMNGAATPAQIAALLVAMRMKGEKPAEVAGLAQAMRERATPVTTRRRNPIDMCGTGGDGKGTFNISTVASFVAAGGGVTVAKHGNRSVSSQCGSADVLEALGVNINLTAAQMSQCLDEVGIAFLFAPVLHSATKHAVGPRKEIGSRTVFNILGPLTNPAGVKRQLLGVYNRDLALLMARVLAELGVEHALVVHSEDGLDEISIHSPTLVLEVQANDVSEKKFMPEDFGFSSVNGQSFAGGSAEQNAQMALGILKGETGSRRNIILANAACGIFVAGLAKTISDGLVMATHSLDSGAALAKLEALRKMSNRFKNAKM
jgi:anthranilate synthase/phosphoribosyltransferase